MRDAIHIRSDQKIDYIELPAKDLDSIQPFYERAFGWSFSDYGPEYRAFTDGKIDGGDLVTRTDGGDNNTIGLIPVGLQLSGNVQPPAILLLNPKIEIKYLSSSTGAVHMIKEKAVRLGVTYWKELDN